MKSIERRQLKQNEFAETTRRAVETASQHRSQIVLAIAAIVVLGGGLIGFFAWRTSRANYAGARIGDAMAIAQSRIAPPSTLPGAQQAAGTYPSETARSEAALKAYQAIIADYGSAEVATAAK